MKLNLAGGDKLVDGYTTVDLYDGNADQRVDLSQFPWPWPDESVDAILIEH